MRAVEITSFGGPQVLVLGDRPRPEPGVGELLIRVAASGINPLDYKIRRGDFPGFTHDFPAILHGDFAGITSGPHNAAPPTISPTNR